MQLLAAFDATRSLQLSPQGVSIPALADPPPPPLLELGLLPQLERAFGELALLHYATVSFGPNYHRARGFAGFLAEALVAPEADAEVLRERAACGRPSVDDMPELTEAFDAGMNLASEVELDPTLRRQLHEGLGGGPRAMVYSELFRLARQACSAC